MPLLLSLSENFDPAGGTWEILAVSLKKILYLSRFSVRNSKKSPNQEAGLENRRPLKVVKDTKFVLNEHE